MTTIGVGAWAIGGGGWSFGWGPQDDAESVAAIHHALELGINWIDTAAVYGHGHSEEVVGRAIRDGSSDARPFVFTKGAQRWDPGRPDAGEEQDLSPASIRRSCEDSLRRLGVECIDLYQIHWPDEQTPIEDSWGEMARLVDEGKTRWIGVSNFDVDLLERCERIRHVDSLQPPLSLLSRATGDELLEWCRSHGTGVIIYSPMESGLLSGRFSKERVEALPDNDWRKHEEMFREPALSRNLEVVESLRAIAERRGVSIPTIAIAWTLAWPGVTGAIVGARRPEQVDDWVDAGSVELSAAELAQLAEVLERTGAGSGPTLPRAVVAGQ